MATVLVQTFIDSLVHQGQARASLPEVRAHDNRLGGGEVKLVIEIAKLAKNTYIDHKGCMCPIGHYLKACGFDPHHGIDLEKLHDPRLKWLQASEFEVDAWHIITRANDKLIPDFPLIIATFAKHDVEVTFV